MAIVEPISQEIVRSYKGTLIFYKVGDQTRVRCWPRWYHDAKTPEQIYWRQKKKESEEAARKLSQSVIDAYKQNTSLSQYTWHDQFISLYMTAAKNKNAKIICVTDFSYTRNSDTLTISVSFTEPAPAYLTLHRTTPDMKPIPKPRPAQTVNCETPPDPEPSQTQELFDAIVLSEIEVPVNLVENRQNEWWGDGYKATCEEARQQAIDSYHLHYINKTRPILLYTYAVHGTTYPGWYTYIIRRSEGLCMHEAGNYMSEDDFKKAEYVEISVQASHPSYAVAEGGAITFTNYDVTLPIKWTRQRKGISKKLISFPSQGIPYQTFPHPPKYNVCPYIHPPEVERAEIGGQIRSGGDIKLTFYRFIDMPYLIQTEFPVKKGEYISFRGYDENYPIISPFFRID